jgi:hypothetical protein
MPIPVGCGIRHHVVVANEIAAYSVRPNDSLDTGEDHWVECSLCRWVCTHNPTRRVAEEQFGRHYQREHLATLRSGVIRSGDLREPAIAWKGQRGIGSLLMTDPGLPRDENDAPYQPCFWFDEDGPIILVRDDDGAALGWGSTEGPDPDGWLLRHMPPVIVAAAEEAEQSWRSIGG